MLGIDQGESATAAAAFAKEMNLRYPILLDEEQQYGRAYAAIGLPTSLIIGVNTLFLLDGGLSNVQAFARRENVGADDITARSTSG